MKKNVERKKNYQNTKKNIFSVLLLNWIFFSFISFFSFSFFFQRFIYFYTYFFLLGSYRAGGDVSEEYIENAHTHKHTHYIYMWEEKGKFSNLVSYNFRGESVLYMYGGRMHMSKVHIE